MIVRAVISRTSAWSSGMSSYPNSIWRTMLRAPRNWETVIVGSCRGLMGTTSPLLNTFLVSHSWSSVLNLGMNSNGNAFGMVFLIMWGGSFIVTINTKLLGGHISFFQCVCVLGYSIFPIVLAAVLIYILKQVEITALFIKMIIAGVAFVWSVFGTNPYIKHLYPSWMC